MSQDIATKMKEEEIRKYESLWTNGELKRTRHAQ